MKQNIFVFSVLLAGLFATACSNKELASDSAIAESGTPVTVTTTAYMPQGNSDTRVIPTDKSDDENDPKLEVVWETSGETFSVLENEGTVQPRLFEQTDFIDSHNAKFEGRILADEGNTEYYAVYPEITETEASAQRVVIDMENQNGELMKSKLYMCAESELKDNNLNFEFKHLTSVLKVNLDFLSLVGANAQVGDAEVSTRFTSSTEIKNITLLADGLMTQADIDIRGIDITNDDVINQYNEIKEGVINIGDRTMDDGVVTVYFHLIPNTLENLAISVEIEGESYSVILKSSKDIKPNTMYIAENVVLKKGFIVSTDGGNPQVVSKLSEIDDISNAYDLKISGNLSAEDLETIAEWAKENDRGTLDLSGTTLTTIKNNQLENCKFTEVILPESATSIGNYAFCGCKNLTSINIPDGVKGLGIEVFGKCSSLTNIVLPESVEWIGELTFENSGLTEIDIPSSVNSITNEVFYGCDKLKKITLPEGVTVVDEYLFYNCSSLESVVILGEITYLGSYAFGGCSSLTEIHFNNKLALPDFCPDYSGGYTTPFDPSLKTNCTLYVPYGYKDLYEEWSDNFYEIVEE